jgi:hypothetical protein
MELSCATGNNHYWFVLLLRNVADIRWPTGKLIEMKPAGEVPFFHCEMF